MTITETATGNGLAVDGEDHQHLYEVYTEAADLTSDDRCGPFRFIACQRAGTWRHGTRYLLVVQIDGYEDLWGTEVEQQDGDEPWDSLDPARSYGQKAGLWRVEAVPSITYRRAARGAGQ